ncbi:unnamed protein product [Phytomonas sp. Hart1]|nr:unnamed protein product [Phytomonas sp. Hart1]|eukprot:CCW72096.1 unnamed protein product [Phytomonas sp. isolate Hart1]
MTDVVASTEAYTKALLHCYKYPSQAVLGFLVGKHTGAGNAQRYVSDVYPLFHSIPMGSPHPMLEVAYAHCESSAKTHGLSLLGVYLANERRTDRVLSPLQTQPLLRYFSSRLDSAVLVWFIDNDSLTGPPTGRSITAFEYSAGGGASVGSPVPRPSEMPPAAWLSFGEWNSDTLSADKPVSEEAALESVNNALEAFAQFKLADFEDHLEDPRLDYIGQPLSSLMNRK